MGRSIALCTGVDKYEDDGISDLNCAERDASKLAYTLESLGFEAEFLSKDVNADLVFRKLRAASSKLESEEDLLVFFFAGHGKTVQQGHGSDQLLLLPSVSSRVLEQGIVHGAPGVLSYRALVAETAQLKGKRLFMFDACRLPILESERAHRDGSLAVKFEGEGVFRGIALSTKQKGVGLGPLTILNSCSDGQRAEELAKYPGGGHGAMTAALLELLKEVPKAGRSLKLNGEYVTGVLKERMGQLIREYGSGQGEQIPYLQGEEVTLYQPEEESKLNGAQRGGKPSSAAALDERLWKLACLKNKVEAYEAYLRESEICAHEVAALERIAALLVEPPEAEPLLEEQVPISPEPLVQKGGVPGGGAKPGVAPPERFVPEVKVLKPLDTFCDLPEGPEMVLLPQGSFMMGATPEERFDRTSWGEKVLAWLSSDEGPQHEVKIAYKLAVGKYAVTFAEWDACVAAGGTSHVLGDEGWGRGRRPVIHVNWEDAQAYLRWLNGQLGLGESDPHRYRLLSEAEWEYACRAGTTGPFNFEGVISPAKVNYDSKYSYGGSAKDASGYRRRTVEVGSLPGNRWGLHEMHGNVWEWVEDCWNGSYSGAPTDGSAWRSGDCERRVLRGGSWYSKPGITRSAFRFRNTTKNRISGYGFRVARMLP